LGIGCSRGDDPDFPEIITVAGNKKWKTRQGDFQQHANNAIGVYSFQVLAVMAEVVTSPSIVSTPHFPPNLGHCLLRCGD